MSSVCHRERSSPTIPTIPTIPRSSDPRVHSVQQYTAVYILTRCKSADIPLHWEYPLDDDWSQERMPCRVLLCKGTWDQFAHPRPRVLECPISGTCCIGDTDIAAYLYVVAVIILVHGVRIERPLAGLARGASFATASNLGLRQVYTRWDTFLPKDYS